MLNKSKSEKKVPLLRYWTKRYLITLLIGLVIIGIIASYWIKYSAINKRLETMNYFASEIADRVVDSDGKIQIGPFMPRIINNRGKMLPMDRSFLIILDEKEQIVFTMPRNEELMNFSISVDKTSGVEKAVVEGKRTYYLVKTKIQNDNDETIGWVMLFSPQEEIRRNPEEIKLLAIMLTGLALLGWGVIYLLTRKLSKPITAVAEASNQIVKGNYNIHFDENIREKELYELVNSFKQMTDRLKQLEGLRTELLAGITHELKTPLTSIIALNQAIKDKVVTGQEAQEFLEITIRETKRMQKMVEDLLDFNSFAVGAIKVVKEEHNLNELIHEITHQWLIGQEEQNIRVKTYLPEKVLKFATDPMRLRQIIYNLLNNAKQALSDNGLIEVTLLEGEEQISIDVKDNGKGIPPEEQDLIFERFYRGKEKVHTVRGLGLGLTFSRMIAHALGGELILKESSPQGTTFSIIFPK